MGVVMDKCARAVASGRHIRNIFFESAQVFANPVGLVSRQETHGVCVKNPVARGVRDDAARSVITGSFGERNCHSPSDCLIAVTSDIHTHIKSFVSHCRSLFVDFVRDKVAVAITPARDKSQPKQFCGDLPHQNSRAPLAHPVQAGGLKRGPGDAGPASPRREASLLNSGPAEISPKSPAGPSFPGWLIRLRDLAIYLGFEFILCVLFGWFAMQPSLVPVVGLVLTLCAMVPPYQRARLWDPFTRSGGGGAA